MPSRMSNFTTTGDWRYDVMGTIVFTAPLSFTL